MTSPLVHGVEQQFWAKAEATYDTATAFAATDAVDLIELKIEPTQEWEETLQHTGTASLQYEVQGKKGGTWSATAYVAPAAAGTAPDVGVLLKAGLGTETVSASTSVTYALNDSAPASLQIARYAGSGLYEIINGAWIETVEFKITGGEAPRITFSGGFASYGWSMSGTTGGTAVIGGSTVTIASASDGRYGINGRVSFASDTNSGAGFIITAVNHSTPSITVSPTFTANITNGEAITPLAISQTLGGTIVGGIACGLSVGGTAIGVISATVTLQTGIHGLSREASAAKPNRLARGQRSVAGELEVYFLDTVNGAYIGRAWDGTLRALIVRAGPDTAASRMKVNAPNARLDVTTIEIPNAEEATAKIGFKARQNSAAADEMTVVFD